MKKHKLLFVLMIVLLSSSAMQAEDGYKLWLRYMPIESTQQLKSVRKVFREVVMPYQDNTFSAIQNELGQMIKGWESLENEVFPYAPGIKPSW